MNKQWKWLLFAGGSAIALLAVVAVYGLPGLKGAASSMPAHLDPHAQHKMAAMSAVLPADMNDPYLDPVSLQMGHMHAAESEQTEAEKAVRVQWNWPDGLPAAGEAKKLRLSIADGDGHMIPAFMVVNEKLLHLVVVSSDLAHFQHVHPVYKGEGIFELPIAFEQSGSYKLYADFMPEGMAELTRVGSVEVEGAYVSPAKLAPSTSMTQLAGGMEVTLHSGELMAGMQSELIFSFRDVWTRKPISDMEPYLGSIGHVVAIDEKLEQYLHVHPVNWAASGPIAVFGVMFPRSGLYKIWGQFQRRGELFIVPFVLEVP